MSLASAIVEALIVVVGQKISKVLLVGRLDKLIVDQVVVATLVQYAAELGHLVVLQGLDLLQAIEQRGELLEVDQQVLLIVQLEFLNSVQQVNVVLVDLVLVVRLQMLPGACRIAVLTQLLAHRIIDERLQDGQHFLVLRSIERCGRLRIFQIDQQVLDSKVVLGAREPFAIVLVSERTDLLETVEQLLAHFGGHFAAVVIRADERVDFEDEN